MPCAPRLLAGLLAGALAVALPGCGSDDNDDDSGSATTARAADFPSAQGKATLGALIRGLPQGPQLAPSTSVLDPGRNRFGFALFDSGGKQVNDAEVAIYTASANQTDVRGPYPASSESLKVKPAYLSRQTAQDPDTAKSVYVADVPFQRRGRHVIIALARIDGRLVASTAIAAPIGRRPTPPRVGERAVRIQTPTAAEAGLDAVETRIPPDSMHDVNFADVVGRQPVVLVFATPQLCQSRVCGPVVDELEQLKSTKYRNGVAFVHEEVFNDNEVQKGYRPQLRAWRLPSEPWVFVIDRSGRVADRIEGATSVNELDRAIAKVAPS